MDIHQYKNPHFIGIGGIGISAIARMMHGEGKVVTGSDGSESFITTELEKLGIEIFKGHQAEHITSEIDLVVYTVAIGAENPELVRAKELNIPLLSYPEALGLATKGKYTIAVAGTHGKTTTTAMLAKILMDAAFDPTVIVGSLLKEDKNNFIQGKSAYFVVEADEYKRSFLNLEPSLLVITNIDLDHLDYYKDLADIQSAFTELASKVLESGYLVTNTSNPVLESVVASTKANVHDYSNQEGFKAVLQVPGKHNIENAKAAYTAAMLLGVSSEQALKSLESFTGTWRRFDLKGTTASGALVYDDYAHNPQKIRAAIAGARELYPDKRIVAVFQPHLYSRTKLLLKDFGISFKDADEVVVAPIYAAREENDPSITSELLVEEIQKSSTTASSLPSLNAVFIYLESNTKQNDVILLIGAGDINTVGDRLIKK